MSHIRAAVSERGVKEIFDSLIENFTFENADSTGGDTFDFGYELELHLESGSVELTNDGTVKIEELDIIWDKLLGRLAIDFDPICIGGQCIPTPFGDICLPEWCVFEGDPDVVLELDLVPFIRRSEISGEVKPEIRYFQHPDRPAGMNYLEAQETLDSDGKNLADKWRLHLIAVWLDADPIDFADVVADIFEEALTAFVDEALSFLPGPVRNVIKAIIGGIGDFLRLALDIVDDIDEWLSDLFNISFGLIDLLLTVIARYLGEDNHVLEFENPMQIMDPQTDPDLIPVKIPLESVAATINSAEMIISAEIGDTL